MKEELKKLRESVHKVAESVHKVVEKAGLLHDSSQKLKESVEGMATALNDFIEVHIANQEHINKRLDRLEKHLGLK